MCQGGGNLQFPLGLIVSKDFPILKQHSSTNAVEVFVKQCRIVWAVSQGCVDTHGCSEPIQERMPHPQGSCREEIVSLFVFFLPYYEMVIWFVMFTTGTLVQLNF